ACINRIYWAMLELERAGLRVVSTWPQNIAAVGTANPRNATSEQREEWAETCISQVCDADVLWIIVPCPQTTIGAWVELGIARMCGKTIVCSGDTKQSIFPAIGHEFSTDAEALGFILKYAGSKRLIAAARDSAALVVRADNP